ncbi:Fe-S cluster assembly ATPase SufC [Candidatus Dojkabacteria bacterium]|nr:Fe-S cluster assembly ATPase SufC [Candidatus Dojkabacteria bacterium]
MSKYMGRRNQKWQFSLGNFVLFLIWRFGHFNNYVNIIRNLLQDFLIYCRPVLWYNTPMLKISNFSVKIKSEDKILAKNIDLEINPGKVNLLIGPNGAGKSTLAKSLMSDPELEISPDSKIILDKQNITDLKPNKKASSGLFVSFQNPVEVPGVKILDFLHSSYNSVRGAKDRIDIWDILDLIEQYSQEIGLPDGIADRNVNEGFSGGEKKKFELLQILLLKPKYAVLDEIDSGADVDTIKTIYSTVTELAKSSNTGFLIISHTPKILDTLPVDAVYLMENGEIKKSGDIKFAKEIFNKGFGNS